jgi:N-methylhydantoinase A
MRYLGQGFEVETPLPGRLDEASRSAIETAFQQAYASRFGRGLAQQRVEIVNWRVEASVAIDAPQSGEAGPFARDAKAAGTEASAPRRTRPAYFPELADFIDTPVIAESALRPGETLTGPALIEQPGSTVVIGPGDRFGLDATGNIRVTLAGTTASA